MEGGMSDDRVYDGNVDPVPDYKLLETIMDVAQDPRKVNDLSEERLRLLLHLINQGLYYRDKKDLGLGLDKDLENFLIYEFSDTPQMIEKARTIISDINPVEDDFYVNMVNLIDFLLIEFLKSTMNLDDRDIQPGTLKFVEQLFSFLQDPLENSNFTRTQILVLASLLVQGANLNKNYALGFYLNDEILDILKTLTPTEKQLDDLQNKLTKLALEENEHVYENFSSLINYIIYNSLKHKF